MAMQGLIFHLDGLATISVDGNSTNSILYSAINVCVLLLNLFNSCRIETQTNNHLLRLQHTTYSRVSEAKTKDRLTQSN